MADSFAWLNKLPLSAPTREWLDYLFALMVAEEFGVKIVMVEPDDSPHDPPSVVEDQ